MNRLIYLLFNLALLPLYPALSLYLLYRRFGQHKSAASVAGLLGVVPKEARFERGPGPRIWLHAVSVGETVAARPLLRALRAELPESRILLSNTTDGGHEAAQALLKAGEVDGLFYFPLDLPFADLRVLNAVRPDAILCMETELWPNLMHLARQRGIPTFLVNGRVSDNLVKMAPRMGPVWKWLTGNISAFLMRDQADAVRLRGLGVPEAKIRVTGDVKLEAPPVAVDRLRREWREKLGVGEELVWLAGSTHPGEEVMMLQAYQKLLSEFPELGLVLAPRHVDRVEEVRAAVTEAGFEVSLRSRGERVQRGHVFILDTVGELADCYAAANVAFVGGSLIKRGGHNVLEPVLRGTPVLFGPFVMNFLTAANLVEKAGLGQSIADQDALAPAVAHWLRDSDGRRAFPGRVEEYLGGHRGAASRMAAAVKSVLREGYLS